MTKDLTAADARELQTAYQAFRRMSGWRARGAAWRWLTDRLTADVRPGESPRADPAENVLATELATNRPPGVLATKADRRK